ncbi:exocyst complex component 3-like [Antedon mediterranea]|uniref:exocyst complex component 3-like n=1 Tax=Antedon mediterranea TaxID=105859 RepID=UPI003AF60851
MYSDDFGQAELDALESARKHVENMLKRPDQLEKVEQYRRREARKKASVEARLKTAMQSQLDGVKTGLMQLRSAHEGIKEIRQSTVEVNEKYQECAELAMKLTSVREVANEHSQLAAAVENLKHIFTVPETIERTERQIEDGQLLLAHKGLMDLEQSRNDLLFELHKQPSENPTDIHLLERYFSKVEQLSGNMYQQIKYLMQNVFMVVRNEPTKVVTCLRIIEREEKLDNECQNKERMVKFHAPGRPKRWKEKMFHELEKCVTYRIEGNQLEDRSQDRMWLVRHLELTRQIILEDLRVVKHLCSPCFPPSYKIFEYFVKTYKDSLSIHLQNMICDELEHNEIISLLTWLTEYIGPNLMAHHELNIEVKLLEPLLPPREVETLQQQYLKTLHANIQKWINNTLDTDIKEWYREVPPEADKESYLHTSLPVIVFQMIEQNMQVAAQISKDLTTKVLLLCVEVLQEFIEFYRSSIRTYKDKHMQDRSQPRHYFQYMVAVINGFQQFEDFTRQLERRHLNQPPGEGSTTVFQSLMDAFDCLAGECLGFLLDEVFLDLEPHNYQLLTRSWYQINGSPSVDTICVTVEDYYNDFVHLRKRYFVSIMKEAEKRVSLAYITALIEKRMIFKTYEERKTASEKICKESEQISNLFRRLGDEGSSPIDAVSVMVELIRLRDTSLLSLEISGLVSKYPDVRTDHVINLLAMREDLGTSNARQMVIDTLEEDDRQRFGQQQRTIFSEIRTK